MLLLIVVHDDPGFLRIEEEERDVDERRVYGGSTNERDWERVDAQRGLNLSAPSRAI